LGFVKPKYVKRYIKFKQEEFERVKNQQLNELDFKNDPTKPTNLLDFLVEEEMPPEVIETLKKA
jgi:hypothetical protein